MAFAFTERDVVDAQYADRFGTYLPGSTEGETQANRLRFEHGSEVLKRATIVRSKVFSDGSSYAHLLHTKLAAIAHSPLIRDLYGDIDGKPAYRWIGLKTTTQSNEETQPSKSRLQSTPKPPTG